MQKSELPCFYSKVLTSEVSSRRFPHSLRRLVCVYKPVAVESMLGMLFALCNILVNCLNSRHN